MRLNPFRPAGQALQAGTEMAAPGKARKRRGSAGSMTALVIGAALTAAMISGAGLAAASARPTAHHAAHPAARAAHAAVRAATSGTEHFQLMTTSPTSPTSTIIADGVFTAGGVDHAGNRTDKVVFPGGTFKIRHGRGHARQSFDPRTCLLKLSVHGGYKLLDGTGAYAGISGHGKYRLHILAIGARVNGKCSRRQAPVAFEQIIKAHGPVQL
jgi:hypothetical protein